jgi:hypothetical protein
MSEIQAESYLFEPFTIKSEIEKYNKVHASRVPTNTPIFPSVDLKDVPISYHIIELQPNKGPSDVMLDDLQNKMLMLDAVQLILPKTHSVYEWLDTISYFYYTIGGNNVSIPFRNIRTMLTVYPELLTSDNINNYINVMGINFGGVMPSIALYYSHSYCCDYKLNTNDKSRISMQISYRSSESDLTNVNPQYMNTITAINNFQKYRDDYINRGKEKDAFRDLYFPFGSKEEHLENSQKLSLINKTMSKIIEKSQYFGTSSVFKTYILTNDANNIYLDNQYSAFIIYSDDSVNILNNILIRNRDQCTSLKYIKCIGENNKPYYFAELSKMNKDFSYDRITVEKCNIEVQMRNKTTNITIIGIFPCFIVTRGGMISNLPV